MARRGQKPADAINPIVLKTMRETSALLTKKGYPHVLIGGLALRHYGYERATSDVDFLVSNKVADEVAGASLGGEVRGKSFRRGRVDIDLLFPREGEEFLENEVRKHSSTVISFEGLVYLKLVAGRMRDQSDVVELLKRCKEADVTRTRKYLRERARRPDLIEELDSLLELSKHER